MAYTQGVVSVGTAATLICTPGEEGVMVQNTGTAAVTLGGATVTAGTAAATGGITLGTAAAPGTIVFIPTGRTGGTVGDDTALYGRVASGTSNVAFLCAVPPA